VLRTSATIEIRARLVVVTVLLLSLASSLGWAQSPEAPSGVDCAEMPCAEVLPGASRFEAVEEAAFKAGYDADDELVGWVVVSTDVVDIRAYSGQPMVTLVGLDTDGVITGAHIIDHSEPILLIGIPEEALSEFVERYRGIEATTNVVVGSSRDPEAVAVDMISGATVTALAQNQTILDTARQLGRAVEVIDIDHTSRGDFVRGEQPWSWAKMQREGVFGRLTVDQSQMSETAESGVFIDLWFTLADAPHVGRALLGDAQYERLTDKLEPGEHLLVVLGNGETSFKGSGFVRGGIFDRVRVEQGLSNLMFRDHDYYNFPDVRAEGAPEFREGAIFITRGNLDPGEAFELVFVGSRYDGKGGFSRDFRAFKASHQLPQSVYRTESRADQQIWRQAWYNNRYRVIALSLFLAFIIGLFIARRWLTGDAERLERLHTGVLVVSFFGLGLWLSAQPSITQLLTLVDGVVSDWRMELFLSEPVIFISWIFLAVIVLVWGRGVFCGWTCPYGAMSELLFRVGRLLRLPSFELPDRVHSLSRYARYGVLVILLGAFLYSHQLGEQMAEVEPFKSTFFVAPWTREWWYFGWWVLLAGLSMVWFRPFCRYLCPLGAALALPSSFRRSGPKRRNFCQSCKICTRQCEPRAIRPDGTIDPRECLSCMECEANYRDEDVCPPLVGLARLRKKAADAGQEPDPERVTKLLEQMEDWR
jgi:NosR/NirI family transcriptional regulator, nitrous oxide reductase regulator